MHFFFTGWKFKFHPPVWVKTQRVFLLMGGWYDNTQSNSTGAWQGLLRVLSTLHVNNWVNHCVKTKDFRTLVTVHLLQSHCTRGLQYPMHSVRRLTGSRLMPGFNTKRQYRPWYLKSDEQDVYSVNLMPTLVAYCCTVTMHWQRRRETTQQG